MKKKLSYLSPKAEVKRLTHRVNLLTGASVSTLIDEYENEGDVEWLD